MLENSTIQYESLEEEDVHERKDKTDQDVTKSETLYITIKDKKKKMDRDHELQHASDMSTDSTSSVIRVEIADLDGEENSINLTTTTLRRCKRQVLRPYWRLLMFIGWRGFGRESVNYGNFGWSCLNFLYPLFVVSLLLYTYVYEIVACQWKLDVHKDTQILTTTTVATTIASQNVTPLIPWITFRPARYIVENLTQATDNSRPEACEHIMTTYIIPNILHFIAYCMGMYHFRIQENEQLYSLMEKTFLQAAPLYQRGSSQQHMIRRLRLFLALGAIWVLFVMSMQGLYEFAFDFPRLALFMEIGYGAHWILFSVELVGILVLNSVTIAVVSNYVTQCEMILFYIKGVALRLQEKSSDLKTAMKDIFLVKQNLSLLNGPIARMTSLVTIIFAELTIIGASILILNKNEITKVWIYRGLFPFVWLLVLCCPLGQAARVNSVFNGIKKIALEMRVFGYKGTSQLDLDSFLLFVSHAHLRAKLFHIPILPAYLIAVIVLSSFILLILFQTSVIGPINYWF